MAAITISKQYGSNAEEITFRVCKLLGYKYFDKRNILRMAQEAGLSEKDLFDITVDEIEKKNLFRKVVTDIKEIPVAGYDAYGTASSGNTMSTFMNYSESLDMDHALTMVQSLLHTAAKKGDIVISGRGGQILLKDYPQVYHLRVIAPLEKRIENVMASESLNEKDAEKSIKKHDVTAAKYLKQTYKIDWDNPELYHLVINTGKVDFDIAAKIIADVVK